MDNPVVVLKDNGLKSWWCGDIRVEKYMPEIDRALDRSGLKGQQRTDVYNRAYEAIYKAICDYDNKKIETIEKELRK